MLLDLLLSKQSCTVWQQKQVYWLVDATFQKVSQQNASSKRRPSWLPDEQDDYERSRWLKQDQIIDLALKVS